MSILLHHHKFKGRNKQAEMYCYIQTKIIKVYNAKQHIVLYQQVSDVSKVPWRLEIFCYISYHLGFNNCPLPRLLCVVLRVQFPIEKNIIIIISSVGHLIL